MKQYWCGDWRRRLNLARWVEQCHISACAIGLLLIASMTSARGNWIAFNDHAPGNGTHAYTARYDVFGAGTSASGFLKNVANGNELPATLTIERTATGVAGANAADNPATNTLLWTVFGGYVDFAGSPQNSVELTGSGMVTYTFAGLNPAERYRFLGSAVRGDPAYTNRWTLCAINGADSYTGAHSSARVLTSAQVVGLVGNEAALNTGANHTSNTGDYVGWDDIAPGADGTFSISCRQYTGSVPGGSASGSKGYALTGVLLEEAPCGNPMPLVLANPPQGQTVIVGAPVVFDIGIIGCPAFYQWHKDGVPIPGARNSSYGIPVVNTNHSGSYHVVVTNAISAITSVVVRLQVFPDRSVPLIPLTQTWRYDVPALNADPSWKEPAFNDLGWLSGQGVLGVEDRPEIRPLIHTALPLTTPGSSPIATYYLRTHFTLTNDPGAVYLSFSNLVDDGAIVCLNGAELFRLNMGDGPVTPATLALEPTEAAFDTVNVVPTNLIRGDNVLAVEIHQADLASSDVVFGLALQAVPLDSGPVIIRRQPQGLSLGHGSKAFFEVEATGQPPFTYEWRRNGIPLPGQTNALFSWPNATVFDDGFYNVRIGNPFGFTHSLPAHLQVAIPGWEPTYATDFERGVGPAWSSSKTSVTPSGGRQFLGQFGAETVSLSLSNLPAHEKVLVSFDLFLIQSWDGNATGFIGPDQWKLEVAGGPVLLHSTFSNSRTVAQRMWQYFPDPYLGEVYPSLSGAEEENSLGYIHGGLPMDSVYRLTYAFDHAGEQLTLQFSGVNLQDTADESWGLDNVYVYLIGVRSLRLAEAGLFTNASNPAFSFRLLGLEQRPPVIIESSTNLAVDGWKPVWTNVIGAASPLFLQPRGADAMRFYRAVEVRALTR